MPHGARNPGVANGPVGQAPRLFGGTAGGSVASGPIRDTQTIRSGATPAGQGFATATLGPVPTDETWYVERISLASGSSSPTTAAVYLGAVEAGNIVDQTTNGESDVADETNPILIPGGQSLLVRWIGISDGANAAARIQFRRESSRAGFTFGG